MFDRKPKWRPTDYALDFGKLRVTVFPDNGMEGKLESTFSMGVSVLSIRLPAPGFTFTLELQEGGILHKGPWFKTLEEAKAAAEKFIGLE